MNGVVNMINQPSKEQVRDWLKHRRLKTEPPPDIEQIRRDLGWGSAEKIDPASSAVLEAVDNI